MEIISVFGVIAGIVFLGFLSEIIFKKTNIPDVLLLIIVGIIIGPVLKWIHPSQIETGAELFTTFALIYILFQGSINIDFKVLLKSLSKTFNLTVLSFLFTVIVTTIIAKLLGYPLILSILIGSILGGTSSAVVIPLVNNVEIRTKYGLVLSLESAISDVLCIVGTITILEIIQTGQFVASGVFRSVLSSFSLALVTGMILGFIWMVLMDKYEYLAKSYMVTIAVVMGIYAFIESPWVKASGAIGILAFGLVLGNSKIFLTIKEKNEGEDEEELKTIRNVLSNTAKSFFQEISFFVKTFFFVYLGILMDFSNPDIFVYGAILTLGIYLIRPLVIKMVFNKDKAESKEITLLEILIPKGLAAAVLAQVAVQSGVLGDSSSNFVSTILSVVLLSIVLTSTLIFLTEKNLFKGFFWFLKTPEIKEPIKVTTKK